MKGKKMKTRQFALLTAVLFLFFGINSAINAQNKDSKAKAPVKTEKQISKKNTDNINKISDVKEKKTETSNNSAVKEKKTDKTMAKSGNGMMQHNEMTHGKDMAHHNDITHHKDMTHHKKMKDESKTKDNEKTTAKNK